MELNVGIHLLRELNQVENASQRQSHKDLRSKVTEAVLKGTEKGILQKLEPAPGWKPFETPAKRKVDGQDW